MQCKHTPFRMRQCVTCASSATLNRVMEPGELTSISPMKLQSTDESCVFGQSRFFFSVFLFHFSSVGSRFFLSPPHLFENDDDGMKRNKWVLLLMCVRVLGFSAFLDRPCSSMRNYEDITNSWKKTEWPWLDAGILPHSHRIAAKIEEPTTKSTSYRNGDCKQGQSSVRSCRWIDDRHRMVQFYWTIFTANPKFDFIA